jgi:hypothetical protein
MSGDVVCVEIGADEGTDAVARFATIMRRDTAERTVIDIRPEYFLRSSA